MILKLGTNLDGEVRGEEGMGAEDESDEVGWQRTGLKSLLIGWTRVQCPVSVPVGG